MSSATQDFCLPVSGGCASLAALREALVPLTPGVHWRAEGLFLSSEAFSPFLPAGNFSFMIPWRTLCLEINSGRFSESGQATLCLRQWERERQEEPETRELAISLLKGIAKLGQHYEGQRERVERELRLQQAQEEFERDLDWLRALENSGPLKPTSLHALVVNCAILDRIWGAALGGHGARVAARLRRGFVPELEFRIRNGEALENWLRDTSWYEGVVELFDLQRKARHGDAEGFVEWTGSALLRPWERESGELSRRLTRVVRHMVNALGYSQELWALQELPREILRFLPPGEEAPAPVLEEGKPLAIALEKIWLATPFLCLLTLGILAIRQDSAGSFVLCLGSDLFCEEWLESLFPDHEEGDKAAEGAEGEVSEATLPPKAKGADRGRTLEEATAIWERVRARRPR